MELTRDALERYREGDVDAAIALLERALALHEEPVIVFNLARAFEARGDLGSALAHFRGYLRLAPDASDRGAVELRIAALEEQLAEQRRLEQEREDARRASEEADLRAALEARRAAEERSRAEEAEARFQPWPWVVVAVGVAGVGGGVTLGILSESREDVAPDADHRTAADALDDASTLATAANVAFGVGSALAVAGLIWGIVSLTSVSTPDAQALREGLRWSF